MDHEAVYMPPRIAQKVIVLHTFWGPGRGHVVLQD